MPLAFTPFSAGSLCEGATWTVNDVQELAQHVGHVALGQSRHVAKILSRINVAPPTTSDAMKKGAIDLLSVPPGADPWHRDGWLFQTISWLAATRNNPSALIRAPHMILAHKGFDGLQLDIDASTGQVTAAVIFEDKATDNPRSTIREEVWPEFRLLEAGDRENVLGADVSGLLITRPDLDADAAIENIIWKEVRRYRISITVGETHNTNVGRNRLFSGFDGVAAGDIKRRRAETLYVKELRPWMEDLAVLAIKHVTNKDASIV